MMTPLLEMMMLMSQLLGLEEQAVLEFRSTPRESVTSHGSHPLKYDPAAAHQCAPAAPLQSSPYPELLFFVLGLVELASDA